MESSALIGKVAAEYLHDRLRGDDQTDDFDGTARFILDCLSAEHTAAIALALLNDSQLKDQVEIKLPAHFVAGYSLPDTVLTDKPATHFRNSPCAKPTLLVANTGFNEEQSIKEIVPIGSPQLLEHPEIWVRVASEGLGLTSDQRKWWEKALTG